MSDTSASAHPGMIFYQGQWIPQDQWEAEMHRKFGWNWQKTLAVAAPFIAGGAGMLAGAGGSAGAAGSAAGGVPSVGATGGVAAGAFPTVAGTAGSGAAAAAAGGGMSLPFGLGGKDLLQAVPLLASLFHRGGNAAPPQQDAMNDLIGMQTQRLKESDPLYQAVLKMAMGLMPTAYQPQAPPAAPMAQPSPQAMPRRLR